MGEPKTQLEYQEWSQWAAELYPELLQRLAFYHEKIIEHPNNTFIYTDWLTLLSWNGNHQEAVSAFKTNGFRIEPIYALEAVAWSARQLSEYPLAESLYEEILQKEPSHKNANLGLAAAQIETGAVDDAINRIEQYLLVSRGDKEALTLLAYAYNQKPDTALQKLVIYQKLLHEDPENGELIRARTMIFLELGLIEQAAQEFTLHPEAFTENDKLDLLSHQNTISIRKFNAEIRDKEKAALLQQALKVNQNYLNLLSLNAEYKTKLPLAVADRLFLLNSAQEHELLISYFSEQKISPSELPTYGIESLADSLLVIGHPSRALKLTEDALQQASQQIKLLKIAYYASLDIHDMVRANDYLERLSLLQPKWRYSSNSHRRKINPDYAEMLLFRAIHHAYVDQLAVSQEKLENLINNAPSNNEYRTNLSTVYRWRGWIDLSQQELQYVFATDVDYLPAKISQTYNYIANNDYYLAEQNINLINQKHHNKQSVERLNDDWDAVNSSTLFFNTHYANPKGTVFSSRDAFYEAGWISKPLNFDWRLFYKRQQSRSESKGINGSYTINDIGVDYKRPWGGFELSALNINGINKSHWSLLVNLKFSDHWKVNAGYQSFSKDTPVRAFVSDVNVESSQAAIEYRLNEGHGYSLSHQYSTFSDGNNRTSIALNGYHKIYQGERSSLSLYENLYWQANSKDTNRLYFNPEEVLSLGASVQFESLLYKNSKTELVQQIILDAGQLKQTSFDTSLYYSITYKNFWQLSNTLTLYYSAGYGQNSYDGQIERGPFFGLGMEAKL
ncbi:MAG: poly-beta-1,6 N-acetyl-D-glucosamine export porin PgaA [Kangiellaceae bacterium]|nr:poly-beta-1,6 N-acetyl-D-glucosamine export porin PgaA [Kangiellaceae bacterium]